MNQFPITSVEKRVFALESYEVMDTAAEPEFDDLTQLASQICEAPMATVTLLDQSRQWFKSRHGVKSSETPIEHAFCAHAIHQPDEVMYVRDATRDARFRGNPFVVGEPHIRFYAGAPLVTPEGVPIGTVCAFDSKSRGLSPGQKASLRAISHQAMALLELRRVRRERREGLHATSTEVGRLRDALQAQVARCEELQTREAYFRHLTEYALDLITILDTDGTIRFESRSIERELGYSPDHYRGRNAFEFVHPEDREEVMQAFTGALQRQGNTPGIRFRFRHADGTYRILEGTGNNLLHDPAVRGIVFNSRDITERVRLQEEVDRAQVEKDDTVARLTGGVAHDFNNILTAIQGLAEITEARLRGTPEAVYVSEIRSATNRAAALTGQLLAVSRRVVLQPQALSLKHWVESIGPRLAGILGTQIELSTAVFGDLSVWQDPGQLEQVILQLATNARDAMPVGGKFTVEAVPVILGPNERPADGRDGVANFVEVTVTDQGFGMAEETLTRVFEPFFTTKLSGNHSGLGLPMCRGIMEQSGGHLTVHSQVGRGTVFRLYLPATDAIASVPPCPVRQPIVPGVATILLVDDEPMLREIGETVLVDSGYRVIVAEDGPSALARLAEMGDQPLDMLLTDVVMPGMNGVQLAAEVESLRPGTRVLLCSGYTRDALAAGGGLPPGVAFLPKPYTLAVLLEKVEEVLGGVRA